MWLGLAIGIWFVWTAEAPRDWGNLAWLALLLLAVTTTFVAMVRAMRRRGQWGPWWGEWPHETWRG